MFKPQDGVEVHVFWKQVAAGSGPACSVFVRGHELIKFDCYGEGNGHYHIALPSPAGPNRATLKFDVATPEQQIGRAIFELANNLVYYCERCVHPEVQGFSLDQSAVANAPEEIRTALIEALDACNRASRAA